MKKNKILIIPTLMACLLTSGMGVNAADVDSAGSTGTSEVSLNTTAATFSVTVPTQLAVTMNPDGTSQQGTAEIVNNSTGQVKVTNVAITAKGGWTLVDFTKDFANTALDTKEFGFQLNTVGSTSDGYAFDAGNFEVMEASGGTCALTYNAKMAPQTQSTSATVADVVFTLDWNTTA